MKSSGASVALDYAGYAAGVEGLGPGKRLVIWVRGCRIGCPGCMTRELWDTGQPTALDDVVNELVPHLAQADGLTISGGEPFDQAVALSALIERLRQHSDLEVLVYSGYTLECLKGRGPETEELLQQIDMLIDGPYIQRATNILQWRGSDNQRVHLLSVRAQRYACTKESPMPEARALQLQMLGPQTYRIIGIPRRGDLEAYRAAMAARGLRLESGDE